MITEYQITVSKDGRMMFVDENGQQVDSWDVLNLANMAGCYISVKATQNEHSPVNHVNVLDDKRYHPVQAWITIGGE